MSTVGKVGKVALGVLGALAMLCVLVVGALLVTNPSAREADGWRRGPDMPAARSEVATTVMRFGWGEPQMVVAAGGFGAPFASTKSSVFRYDPHREQWDELPDLPGSRHHAGAAGHDRTLYVSGGGSSATGWTPRRDLWALPPGADAWEERAPMPEGRLGHRMEAVEGTLYVVGGDGPSAAVLAYDPHEDRWERRAELPVPRDHLATAVPDGRIWAIGGRSHDDGGGLRAEVDIYDPGDDRWIEGPSLPEPASAMVAGVVGGSIHVVGGEDPALRGGRVHARHWVLEVDEPSREGAQGEWRDAPLPVFDVHGMAGGAAEGELIVAGGSRRQGLLTPLALTGAVQHHRPEGR